MVSHAPRPLNDEITAAMFVQRSKSKARWERTYFTRSSSVARRRKKDARMRRTDLDSPPRENTLHPSSLLAPPGTHGFRCARRSTLWRGWRSSDLFGGISFPPRRSPFWSREIFLENLEVLFSLRFFYNLSHFHVTRSRCIQRNEYLIFRGSIKRNLDKRFAVANYNLRCHVDRCSKSIWRANLRLTIQTMWFDFWWRRERREKKKGGRGPTRYNYSWLLD